MNCHGVGEVAMRLVIGETFSESERTLFVQIKGWQLFSYFFPMHRLVIQIQSRGHFGSSLEGKLHQGKVVVGHVLEPSLDTIVEYFGT